jgi:hypothetical protein
MTSRLISARISSATCLPSRILAAIVNLTTLFHDTEKYDPKFAIRTRPTPAKSALTKPIDCDSAFYAARQTGYILAGRPRLVDRPHTLS